MPADTAPAWPDLQAEIIKLIQDFYAPWGSWKTAWWEGVVGDCKEFSADNLLREIARRLSEAPCLTPSEHHQRTLAASAASWMAAREAAYAAMDALPDHFRWRAEQLIRALPPPADAAAALAEVVRKAKREAFEEAAQVADRWLEAFKEFQPVVISPRGYACNAVQDIADAIRARGEGGGA